MFTKKKTFKDEFLQMVAVNAVAYLLAWTVFKALSTAVKWLLVNGED